MKRILALGLAWTALVAAGTGDDVAALLDKGKPIEAFMLAQQKSTAGDPEGDFALAWFYDNGDHISADKAKAVELYRRCADAGLSPCQWRLGVMFDSGEGVAENPAAAFAWISKAAGQGNSGAKSSLAVLHAMGRGTPVDYGKAMDLYKAAAKGGEVRGLFGVGTLYALGQGVAADPETAAAWVAVAAALGDAQAQALFDKMTEGRDAATLDRIRSKADAIYTEYVGPLAPVPAPAAPAPKTP